MINSNSSKLLVISTLTDFGEKKKTLTNWSGGIAMPWSRFVMIFGQFTIKSLIFFKFIEIDLVFYYLSE